MCEHRRFSSKVTWKEEVLSLVDQKRGERTGRCNVIYQKKKLLTQVNIAVVVAMDCSTPRLRSEDEGAGTNSIRYFKFILCFRSFSFTNGQYNTFIIRFLL